MNPLVRAILDGRSMEARRIARERPTLLSSRPGDADLVSLAARHGQVHLEVMLRRLRASGAQTPCDVEALFLAYLRNLSALGGAEWLVGIDRALWLWHRAGTPRPPAEPLSTMDLDESFLMDLRYLVARAGGWIAWPDGAEEPLLVSEADMRAAHEEAS